MASISQAIQNIHYGDTALAAPRKTRVLLVITGLATGGATNVVLDIASHFHNRPDFEVQLLTGPVPPGRTDVSYLAQERGILTQEVPSLVNQISPFQNLKALAAVWWFMARGKYDIVHTHSSVAGIVGRLAALAAGTPTIIHHVHGWGIHDGMSGLTRNLYLRLERLCAKFTDRIVAVSRPDIEKGLAQGIGNREKYSLIYNGINLEKFRQSVDEAQVRAELGLDAHAKLVGMVGRLDEQKNPMDFIRAAAIVAESDPNVQFLVIGDGPLRPECEQLIEQLGLQGRFFLLGFRNDVDRILPILTMTAMSSLWEGLPLAFLEALSAGKPIVANNIDGAREVVVNGQTGYLVTPRQPREMAQRILALLNDEALRKRMERVAQRRSGKYSLERMVRKVEVLYRELRSSAEMGLPRVRRMLRWAVGGSFGSSAGDFNPARRNILVRMAERYGRFQAPFSERRLLLALGDAGSILLAQALTILILSGGTHWNLDVLLAQRATWNLFLPSLLIWFSLAWLNDLYQIPSSYKRWLSIRRILQTTAMAMLIYAAVFLLSAGKTPHANYLLMAFLLVPLVASWRGFYAAVFKRNAFRQRVLLVGNYSRAKATLRDIQTSDGGHYEVVGYVHENASNADADDLKYLGRPRQLLSMIDRYRIHEIVVAIDGKLRNPLFERLVECQAIGVRVNWVPDFYERLYRRLPMEQIDASWALYMMQNRAAFNRLGLGLKRILDLVLVLLALPFFLLILVPVALAIKLETPGPVFYRQVRSGRAGSLYKILKFRTMVVDAERDGKARWAAHGDPRITRVGHFLRKARVDEMPQLLNVLRGEMSIVGPRPERPEFVAELAPEIRFYRMRFLVKPGITGWSQINYEYGNSVEDARIKLQYDLYYVRYWSLWLDLYILFRTVAVMLQLKGM